MDDGRSRAKSGGVAPEKSLKLNLFIFYSRIHLDSPQELSSSQWEARARTGRASGIVRSSNFSRSCIAREMLVLFDWQERATTHGARNVAEVRRCLKTRRTSPREVPANLTHSFVFSGPDGELLTIKPTSVVL